MPSIEGGGMWPPAVLVRKTGGSRTTSCVAAETQTAPLSISSVGNICRLRYRRATKKRIQAESPDGSSSPKPGKSQKSRWTPISPLRNALLCGVSTPAKAGGPRDIGFRARVIGSCGWLYFRFRRSSHGGGVLAASGIIVRQQTRGGRANLASISNQPHPSPPAAGLWRQMASG